ncbi:sensor histidine kinase [Streptomyces sp. NPDC002990]
MNAVQALCRQVCAFRLVLIALGAPLALGRAAPGAPAYLLGGAALLALTLSYGLFRHWERWGPLLLRHRWLLAVDLALSTLLLAAAPPGSPLGLVSLCTPLLAGLAHGRGGAALCAAAQAVAAAALAEGPALPLLCVLAGAAGAAGVCVRDLLFRFGAASRTLAETRTRLAVTEAVGEERARLAREMHDSVAKSLHGLALAAEALSRTTTDPSAVRRQADLIADAARCAAAESRDLLTDLRRDPYPPKAPGVWTGPGAPGGRASLAPALGALCSAAGTEFRVSGGIPVLPAEVAHHLVCVASEALENARRHADAGRVVVEAAVDGTGPTLTLTLTVEDDGHGLPAGGPDVTALRRTGRFGLIGMTERAAAIGARIDIGPRPAGGGTRVRLALPLAAIASERGA